MENIRIIADSTCDLDPVSVQGEELAVLPLTITIGDKSYLDGEEIGVGDVYNAMRAGIVPKTSQIPYGRTVDLVRALFERGIDVIYIAFSSDMSGCYSTAVLAAADLREEYPDRRFAVIDSRGGSGATGLMVRQALRLVRDMHSFQTVVSEMLFMAANIEHVFSVDDMEWLAKGGRIPRIVGVLGNKIDMHPILIIENGRMKFYKMLLGKRKAIQFIADEVIRRVGDFQTQLISITHGDDLISARMLEDRIKKGLPHCLTTLCHIGGVVGTHIGLKGIGAFCFSKKPEHYSLA